jgi:hypothetical protein
MRDWPDAADTSDEVLPAFVCADTQRADQPNSRYHYPASHGFKAPDRASGFVLASPELLKISGFILANPDANEISGLVLAIPELKQISGLVPACAGRLTNPD